MLLVGVLVKPNPEPYAKGSAPHASGMGGERVALGMCVSLV